MSISGDNPSIQLGGHTFHINFILQDRVTVHTRYHRPRCRREEVSYWLVNNTKNMHGITFVFFPKIQIILIEMQIPGNRNQP
jgi:hypothetical protein